MIEKNSPLVPIRVRLDNMLDLVAHSTHRCSDKNLSNSLGKHFSESEAKVLKCINQYGTVQMWTQTTVRPIEEFFIPCFWDNPRVVAAQKLDLDKVLYSGNCLTQRRTHGLAQKMYDCFGNAAVGIVGGLAVAVMTEELFPAAIIGSVGVAASAFRYFRNRWQPLHEAKKLDTKINTVYRAIQKPIVLGDDCLPITCY